MTYKPITESVRGIYTDRVEHILGSSREQIRAEFDAWLNEELAKAWHEGVMTALNSEGKSAGERARALLGNPYRKDEE